MPLLLLQFTDGRRASTYSVQNLTQKRKLKRWNWKKKKISNLADFTSQRDTVLPQVGACYQYSIPDGTRLDYHWRQFEIVAQLSSIQQYSKHILSNGEEIVVRCVRRTEAVFSTWGVGGGGCDSLGIRALIMRRIWVSTRQGPFRRHPRLCFQQLQPHSVVPQSLTRAVPTLLYVCSLA